MDGHDEILTSGYRVLQMGASQVLFSAYGQRKARSFLFSRTEDKGQEAGGYLADAADIVFCLWHSKRLIDHRAFFFLMQVIISTIAADNRAKWKLTK
jgi:hypothetical protein